MWSLGSSWARSMSRMACPGYVKVVEGRVVARMADRDAVDDEAEMREH